MPNNSTQSIEKKLAEMYGQSLLPGSQGRQAEEKVSAQAVEKEEDALGAKIGHLDPLAQESIRVLSGIMARHPIRPCLSEDLSRAWVHCPAGIKEQAWEVLGRFRKHFFGPHHEIITQTFTEEMVAAGCRLADRRRTE